MKIKMKCLKIIHLFLFHIFLFLFHMHTHCLVYKYFIYLPLSYACHIDCHIFSFSLMHTYFISSYLSLFRVLSFPPIYILFFVFHPLSYAHYYHFPSPIHIHNFFFSLPCSIWFSLLNLFLFAKFLPFSFWFSMSNYYFLY